MLSPCLQNLKKEKSRQKNSDLFYNLKLKKQTIHILHDLNKEYPEKYKTTLTKQPKEILHIPNLKSIAYTIKENIELQMEISFKR